MARRDQLLDEIERAAAEIVSGVEALREGSPAEPQENGGLTRIRMAAEGLGRAMLELSRLEALSGEAPGGDRAATKRIQARFRGLPREASAVDLLIAERRLEAAREELDSYDH
jgi:hypothetical protein